MKTIFLAEGQKHVNVALRLLIETQPGMRVVGEANDAEAFLAEVCAHPPDATLLDWHLPGIHHQRLVRTLRDHCPAMQIVVTSVRPEHEKAALAWGLDGFLSKQLPPESFIGRLAEILSHAPG